MRAGRRLRPMLAIAVIAAALAAALGASGAVERLEGDTVNARFELRGERPAPDVAVVAIDSETFQELRRWPFRRRVHAQVIDRLRQAGARQVAYDVQFTEPSDRPADDQELFDAVARSRNAVLSTTEFNERGESQVLGGDEALRSIGARAANTIVDREAGAIRSVAARVQGVRGFAATSVEAATGRRQGPASFPREGRGLIDYAGPPGTIRTLSFARVAQGRFDPADVRGRIVVVGATVPSLQDMHATPTSGNGLMPGPEIHANAISTIMRGFPLREAPVWLGLLAMGLLALVAPLGSLRLSAPVAGVCALGSVGLYCLAAKLAFDSGLVLPLVVPAFAAALSTTGSLGWNLVAESRERRRTRDLFGRFVHGAVVKELLDRPGAGRRLAGERLDASVLFCDLRGFTTFAESCPAERVLDVLNRYLGEMSEAILDRGGTVVSYMGDGIMAVFGAPIERPDHAQIAYDTAREMLEVRMPRVNAWLREQGLPEFRLGVGINSGAVMSGTVGSDRRLEYATIGDTTNVAARLEAMTKETGGGLMLADSTQRRIKGGSEDLERRGELDVRGRAEPVVVWHLPAPQPVATEVARA